MRITASARHPPFVFQGHAHLITALGVWDTRAMHEAGA